MSYVHHIPGRLRVRCAAIKRDSRRAGVLRRWVESLEGVERVEVNPVTGGVLIYYRIAATDGERLLAHLRAAGWVPAGHAIPHQMARKVALPARREIERAVAQAIVKFAAKAVIERSVIALAAAVL